MKGSSKNKNYLLSLYDHCRELAYLVSESESMSRGLSDICLLENTIFEKADGKIYAVCKEVKNIGFILIERQIIADHKALILSAIFLTGNSLIDSISVSKQILQNNSFIKSLVTRIFLWEFSPFGLFKKNIWQLVVKVPVICLWEACLDAVWLG